jgi:hypothetical protein
MKPPDLDLYRGGICPCLVLWRGTCPCWLSPANSDPGSTQNLTRHRGVKSQTVSQLMNNANYASTQLVQPIQIIETPDDRICALAAHLLTTQMEPEAP